MMLNNNEGRIVPMRLPLGGAGVCRGAGLAVALLSSLAPTLTYADEPVSPSPLLPASPEAALLADLYWLVFWMAVAVFVLVQGLLLYSAIRFRRRNENEQPAQIHGNARLELAWTVAPALIIAAIFVLSLDGMNAVNAPPAAAGGLAAVASANSNICFVGDLEAEEAAAFAGTSTLTVQVTGHQWWWRLGYPEYGFETATDMYVPVGAVVKLEMESKDVIHSWWVPQLNGKQDVNPGSKSYSWFQAEREGVFEGQCSELCGDSHAYMPMRVIAVAPEAFQRWTEGQAKGSPTANAPTEPLAAQGRLLYEQKGCASCHAISGVATKTPSGQVGPNLTNIAGRTQIAGYLNYSRENMAAWLKNPQTVKPGTKMPNLQLKQEEIDALVAYLDTLK